MITFTGIMNIPLLTKKSCSYQYNPHRDKIIGREVYHHLDDVRGIADVVQVFRPSEEAPAIVREVLE
jgi:predicted CoA-binding protein